MLLKTKSKFNFLAGWSRWLIISNWLDFFAPNKLICFSELMFFKFLVVFSLTNYNLLLRRGLSWRRWKENSWRRENSFQSSRRRSPSRRNIIIRSTKALKSQKSPSLTKTLRKCGNSALERATEELKINPHLFMQITNWCILYKYWHIYYILYKYWYIHNN